MKTVKIGNGLEVVLTSKMTFIVKKWYKDKSGNTKCFDLHIPLETTDLFTSAIFELVELRDNAYNKSSGL